MGRACSSTGLTRDGLWLIENGKITKAVKNFRFTESPLFVLNQVEQLGVPVPVFRPVKEPDRVQCISQPTYPYYLALTPAVVPPLKARDFSFTAHGGRRMRRLAGRLRSHAPRALGAGGAGAGAGAGRARERAGRAAAQTGVVRPYPPVDVGTYRTIEECLAAMDRVAAELGVPSWNGSRAPGGGPGAALVAARYRALDGGAVRGALHADRLRSSRPSTRCAGPCSCSSSSRRGATRTPRRWWRRGWRRSPPPTRSRAGKSRIPWWAPTARRGGRPRSSASSRSGCAAPPRSAGGSPRTSSSKSWPMSCGIRRGRWPTRARS